MKLRSGKRWARPIETGLWIGLDGRLLQLGGNLPPGTAYVDDGCFAKRTPVERIEERLEWYHRSKGVHGTRKASATFRMGLHLVVKTLVGVESKAEALIYY